MNRKFIYIGCTVFAMSLLNTIGVQAQEQNEAATSSTCLGFVFDPEPVQNEIANVNTAWEKYNNDLLTGAIDPETTVPTIIDELNAAGLQTVIDEAQKQLDAFFAE